MLHSRYSSPRTRRKATGEEPIGESPDCRPEGKYLASRAVASTRRAPAGGAIYLSPKGLQSLSATRAGSGSSTAPPEVGLRPLSICHVWDGEYPWDVRVQKVSAALTARGHHVHLIARNRTNQPVEEQLPEAMVHRLRPWRWAPQGLNAASMFPAFFNPRWIAAIERVARTRDADLILCRDLPLAPASIFVARRLGIPVVLDMAENYPAMLRSRWATGRTGRLDVLVRNPAFAERVERWVLSRLDGVFVVIDESADRLTALGVPPERIAVVGNTPPLVRLDHAAARQDAAAPLRVVYLGLIEAQRGIGTVLDAIALLKAGGVPVRLTVYGDGVDGALFRQHAASMGLDAADVDFRGRVTNAVALASLPSAHVGVVPHWKDESWDTTIPNKLFDYMAAGLAVVTSDAIPAARVVRTASCGRVYHDRNAAELASALRQLVDAGERVKAAERGRAAIRSTWNWEQDASRMFGLIERVVG